MLDFTGKTVIVTGSGSGIGKGIALLFAKQGANVAVNSVRQDTGDDTMRIIKEEIGRKSIFVQGDVSTSEISKKLIERTIETFGRIDILVNNAGITICGDIEETSEEEYDRVMDVNVKSAFLMSKFTVPHMRKAGGGVIVNMSSCVAFRAQRKRAVYAATKSAMMALTKNMALDYISENIRVNCICPGAVYTEKMEERFLYEGDGDREKGLEFYKNYQPTGRLGKDSEIAAAVLFAACEEASFMDGSAIVIDGGRTL